MVRRTKRRDPALEQFWRRSIAERERSGLSVHEYCVRHGAKEANFYAWRREIAKRDRAKALPKSKIGEALTFSANQWPSLIRYLDDGRLKIDNSPAEQAIRPLAVGRRNWLHVAGDGGLR